MSGWTKEPWGAVEQNREVRLTCEDYMRARDCVTACGGIPDPERAIAAAREALRLAKWASDDEIVIKAHEALALLEPKEKDADG